MKPLQVAVLSLALAGCGEVPNCPKSCDSIQMHMELEEIEMQISDLEERTNQLVVQLCDTHEKVLMLCQKQNKDCHEIEKSTLCHYDTDQ